MDDDEAPPPEAGHPGAEYVLNVIRARCGEEIAAAVVPVESVTEMLEIIAALQDRVDEMSERLEPRQAA
jgi:hypothetical protein